MKIETLLTDNLDIWANAIERRSTAGRGRSKKFSLYGIVKLRALILDLAIRGKLVEQDSKDEPATNLVKQFRLQRADWIASKKMRDGKSLPPLKPEEFRQVLPSNWCWIRLNDLGDWGAGATPNRKTSRYYGGSTPWFKSGELDADFIDTAEETVSDLALKECSLRLNQPGDVLIAMYGATIGKTSILKVEATTNQAVCACTPFAGMYNRYLHISLKAMRELFVGKGWGGAQPNISREKIVATPFPLPPLAEQHRIVAKVDELMALCDALEAGAYDAIEAHSLLVKELLATLTSSASAQDFAQNWARIETHFDTLFTTEDSIDQLKQTILQLAVMGKLVPQDPDDEPAENLFKGTGTRLTTKLASHGKSSFAGELPIGWVLHPLGSIGDIVGGGTPSKSNPEFWNGDIPWVSPKDMKQDYISDAADKISRAALESSATKLVKTDSLLIVVRGMILAHSFPVAITTAEVTINQDMKAIELGKLSPAYVLVMMKGMKPDFLRLVERSSHGTCKLVSARLWATLLPIPPLAEQARIVLKVRELTAILDTLKLQLSNAEHQKIELAHAISSRILG